MIRLQRATAYLFVWVSWVLTVYLALGVLTGDIAAWHLLTAITLGWLGSQVLDALVMTKPPR